MTIKAERITSEEALWDIQPTPAPENIPQQRWNEGMPRGQREPKDLAWYRGRLAGLVESILALQEMEDPGSKLAASRLQKHFHLNDDGAIVIKWVDDDEETP